jgi:hydroxyquinol 1,2-dioxygenase
MRPAHIHFMITAPGYRRLTTHLFAAADPYLGDDAVFGVVDRLVVPIVDHGPDQPPPPGGPAGGAWSSIGYDFVLAPQDPSDVAHR